MAIQFSNTKVFSFDATFLVARVTSPSIRHCELLVHWEIDTERPNYSVSKARKKGSPGRQQPLAERMTGHTSSTKPVSNELEAETVPG